MSGLFVEIQKNRVVPKAPQERHAIEIVLKENRMGIGEIIC